MMTAINLSFFQCFSGRIRSECIYNTECIARHSYHGPDIANTMTFVDILRSAWHVTPSPASELQLYIYICTMTFTLKTERSPMSTLASQPLSPNPDVYLNHLPPAYATDFETARCITMVVLGVSSPPHSAFYFMLTFLSVGPYRQHYWIFWFISLTTYEFCYVAALIHLLSASSYPGNVDDA